MNGDGTVDHADVQPILLRVQCNARRHDALVGMTETDPEVEVERALREVLLLPERP